MRTSKQTLGAAAVALGAALTLAGCSLLPAAEPTRDETGQITQAEDNADVFALKVGDCLNSGDLADETSAVPVIPCADAHEDEVYYAHKITEATFPGDDKILEIADDVCAEHFEDFVGLPLEESELNFWNFFPSKDTWAENDREILCMAYHWDAVTETVIKTTGTLANAKR